MFLPVSETVVEICGCNECCWGFFLGSLREVLGDASFFEGAWLGRGRCCCCDGWWDCVDWAGEFWAEDDGEEDDEDEEDDEVEEEDDEEVEEDVGTDCCGFCPFLLGTLLVTETCFVSAVRTGDWLWAVTAPAAWRGSTWVGEDARAGDGCFDDGCCLDFSSTSLSGGVSLFLRGGSSFGGAGVGLGTESKIGPFTGLRPSFFSDSFLFFLSFLPLPCFWRNIFEGIHCKFWHFLIL